ncbi:Ig-like domain-containing protein [Anaeromyxobacter oryzisoli]|uniref:Ig-like domain-containing protein n=1 Tax=Anaeromyxobacter oryzisoli TaxID=2925408 RepID=UPI001F570172|nr:Ig-like domain-containing protein [Anaeromyxobacter sp. SG63]
MALRTKTSLTLALVLLVTACRNVEQDPPNQVVIATFSSPDIPTPNDLALQAVPTLPDGTQKELLRSFVERGGFPSDQEVAITVPIKALAFDAATNTYRAVAPAPTVNVATITPQTAAVLRIDGGTAVVVDTEAGPAAPGTIVIRKKADASGSRRWAPGRYVFALRGGAQGVKTTDGIAVAPDTALALTIPNKDLSKVENQPTGATPDLVAQLEALRAALWSPLDWAPTGTVGAQTWAPCEAMNIGCLTGRIPPAFAAVDAAFPHAETASIATFGIAPALAVTPLTDAGSGQIPLPSNLLLDGTRPVPGTTNRFFVRNVPAFGPAAAGLATLDGFSTTGMVLSPLSGPVDAATITNQTVFLFELPDDPATGSPRMLRDVATAVAAGAPGTAEILIQPPDLNQAVTVGGATRQATTAIGLQPGVPVPVSPTVTAMVPPLKEKKNYAVVVTRGVKDLAGNPLVRSTLANLVFTFTTPLVDASGRSQIPNVSDADAAGLAAMRAGLMPLVTNVGALTGSSLTADDVVMAYTVQTQTVTDASVKLSAFPYDPNGDGNPADSAFFTTTNAAAFDPTAALGLPASFFPDVSFLTATLTTFDAIDPATGAFGVDASGNLVGTPTGIPVLVALPSGCAASAPCSAPLVVWHHALNGSRLQMLAVAESLARRGFVVAAIDAPYHGERAFCAQNSDCTTDGTADGVCTPDQAKAGQGDAIPPGTCTVGHLREANLSTVASGNYFLTANFFRIRDGFRQMLVDEAALILALARPPAASGFPQPAANAVVEALAAKGVTVDPTAVYFQGLSLGGISGGPLLATNPRFARGVLDAPGGPLVDVFTTAPAFAQDVDALFLGLGIDRSKIATDPNVAARYLQTLILAKWIIDPAEPVNYAAHVRSKLPSPLLVAAPSGFGGTGMVHPTAEVFGQLANCDQVVPNLTTVVNGRPLPYGDLLVDLAGLATTTTLYTKADGAGGTTGFCVPHGTAIDTFLSSAIGGPMREDAAAFLFSPPTTIPPQVTLQ